jgi:hypothetical protein
VYVENAGEFYEPMDSVVSVQSEKVTFDCKKLDARLPTTRSAKGLAVGERGGVARSLVPSPRTRRWKSAP